VPRDDLRSGAVHGVQLALGQRFRLAMRPQRGIQGEHRLAGGRHLGRQQLFQCVQIQPSVAEGGIQARPLAAEHRCQAQLSKGGNAGMHQQRLEQLK